MQKTIIELPDGTLISSGSNAVNAIKSCTITESVNVGTDLEPGSAYANKLKMEMFTPDGNLSIGANQEVTVYKEAAGVREKAGIFILEKPTRPTANTMKLTGYDRVLRLDRELAPWLNSLTGWPYNIHDFADMVCTQCGLVYKRNATPNGDFPVYQFTRSSVTGRQIMQWIGQILCRFCRATADGEIEFAWYSKSDVQITASGDLYYFQGGLTYEAYDVEPVTAVQIRLADSNDGALWPEAAAGSNSYIIAGNAILNARITDEILPFLEEIRDELAAVTYKPCRVRIPSTPEIKAGSIVDITDKNGVQIKALVMTKTQSGQADTLECTGNLRRDGPSALSNQSTSSQAQQAAQNAFAGMTPEQVLNKLTNNGKIQGIYQQDGKWYINAELAQITNLKASDITSGKFTGDRIDGSSLVITKGATIAGWDIDENSIYKGTNFGTSTFMCTGSTGSYSIGGSGYLTGWVFGAGGKFGVTKAGAVWCSDIHASGGTIGGWTIQGDGLSSGSLPPPWAASSEDVETITIKKWGVFRAYYDSFAGDDHSEYAYWNWIIGCAREWAEANGLT